MGVESNWTAVTGEESDDSDDAIRKQEDAMSTYHERHRAAVRARNKLQRSGTQPGMGMGGAGFRGGAYPANNVTGAVPNGHNRNIVPDERIYLSDPEQQFTMPRGTMGQQVQNQKKQSGESAGICDNGAAVNLPRRHSNRIAFQQTFQPPMRR